MFKYFCGVGTSYTGSEVPTGLIISKNLSSFLGVNKNNSNQFCSAISDHAHLESLSVWINKNSQNCLDGISSDTPPPKNLQSLKLFGLVNKLPVWINLLRKIKKVGFGDNHTSRT